MEWEAMVGNIRWSGLGNNTTSFQGVLNDDRAVKSERCHSLAVIVAGSSSSGVEALCVAPASMSEFDRQI
jgi:hypothetical protein